MARFFDTMLHRPITDDREQRLVELIDRGHGEALARELLAELMAGLPSEPVLARIAGALYDRVDDPARLDFWRDVAARYPEHAYVQACRGDALLDADRRDEAMDALLSAFERAPLLIQDFDAADEARAAGGEAWLRYQLAELRAAMVAAEQAHAETEAPNDDDDADIADLPDLDVRERYSELLEEYDGDARALALIRQLGSRITELEDLGVLPRALVRRGTWRR